MRDLYFRVGSEDLPLFVTAVAIQSSTGGNLGEILENLSGVIRDRFKMRRKIRPWPRKDARRRSSCPHYRSGFLRRFSFWCPSSTPASGTKA